MDNTSQQVWPGDVDGDVFRRLEEHCFDFKREANIDFNVDFDAWPRSGELLELLRKKFPNVSVYAPDCDGDGYVQATLPAILTYDLVTSMQSFLTSLARPYGGRCESWGVMQD